jgi:anti-sigma factor RsiW
MADSEELAAVECRQIAELVTDYLEGSLPKHTRELLEWHIEGCEPCVAFMNTFRGTLHAIRRLPAVPIPPELKQRLLAVLRARDDQTRRERT